MTGRPTPNKNIGIEMDPFDRINNISFFINDLEGIKIQAHI
jgi:hypothetical protein